jgi:hypothetical protein
MIAFCNMNLYQLFKTQDPFFNKRQREKCVLLGVIILGKKAGKMRKATAQALLRMVVWSD